MGAVRGEPCTVRPAGSGAPTYDYNQPPQSGWAYDTSPGMVSRNLALFHIISWCYILGAL